MVSSDLLDIVIGVVFAWFLLSLVVSFVGEAFAYLTKTRSKLLWRSLSQLFDSGVSAADGRLRSVLIRVPLGKDDIRPVSSTEPSIGSKARSKVPQTVSVGDDGEPIAMNASTSPVNALYELLRRRVPDPAPGNWRTRISQVPTKVVGDALQSLAAATVTRESLLSSLDANSALRPIIEAGLTKVEAARVDPHNRVLDKAVVLENLPPLDAQQSTEFETAWTHAERVVTLEDIEALLAKNPALLARVRAAASTVEGSAQVQRAREEVERWFDGAMDGLSTFYRRQNRKILAVVAIIVVLWSNSGAFHLFQRLHDDNDLRAASATAAASWAAQPLATDNSGALDLSAACARITGGDDSTSGGAPPTTASTSPPTTLDPVAEARIRFKCAGHLLGSTDLLTPLGPSALWTEIRNANHSGWVVSDLASWTWHSLSGRIVTWVALLFGASFWYDALRRLIGLKGKLGGGGGSS